MVLAQSTPAPFPMAPFAQPSDEHTPARVSNARILGIITVAVLVVAFAILSLVVCTRKEKPKEIDLSKPLILTEEVGKKKKKKKKSKKNKKEEDIAQSVEEDGLIVGDAEVNNNNKGDSSPPRIAINKTPLPTDPKSSSDDIHFEIHSESSFNSNEDMSDSQRYRSAT